MYKGNTEGLNIGKSANVNELEGKILANVLHLYLKLILESKNYWLKYGEWLSTCKMCPL